MTTVSKFTQLNFIGDVWEPHYSSRSVYIATSKVNRSKLDIKLKFEKVNDTSEYAGLWYLPRKKATRRKGFDNNGLACFIIPWGEFDKLEVIDKEDLYG